VGTVAPRDLPHWIGSVYLGIFSGRGVTGGKLSAIAGYEPKPVWYYPALLYREHFYLAPLVLFGLPSLLRRNRAHAIEALAMAFAACLAVVVLSVPAVKEPLYVLAVVPLLYILAGVSLAELENDTNKDRPANAAVVQTVIVLAGLSALSMWIAKLVEHSGVGAREVALHTAGMVACTLIGMRFLWRRSLAPGVLSASALALALFVSSGLRAQPHADRAIAPLLARVALETPLQPMLIAPHAKRLTAYLHRSVSEWQKGWLSVPHVPAPAPCEPAAFVLGPDQLAEPHAAATLRELAHAGQAVDLGAAASGYQAFVVTPAPSCARSRN
jgi:hypothetical protein